MKTVLALPALVAFALMPLGLPAQEASASAASPAEHFYRLNLTVEEVNDAGKVTNTRSYVATIATGPEGRTQEIRTGSRIPMAASTEKGNVEVQYVDVGVNFDVNQVKEIGDKLSFNLSTVVSSLAPESKVHFEAGANDPVIRQNRWQATVAIPVGKPTVVFSSDDLDDTGKMQVELMATPVE